MADVLTKEQRHLNMKRIKGSDTKPEILLRRCLWNKGYRYRKNYDRLPGKPDVVLTKYKIAIFVDGEFWHGKGFNGGYESKSYTSLKDQLEHGNNSKFWIEKITSNIKRDRENDANLMGLGWKVLRFWSKDILKDPEQCLIVIEEAIQDINMQEEEC